MAQEKENPRFKLLDNVVTSTLKFESSPVYTTDIQVYIFTAEDKRINNTKIAKELTILRGKTTHSINVSSLPIGNYIMEIIQKGKGRIYKKLFTKE